MGEYSWVTTERGSAAEEDCSWTMFSAFRKGEKYKDHFASGVYECAKCGYELFSSAAKYAHQSPWPAFSDTFHPDSVSKVEEKKGALKLSLSGELRQVRGSARSRVPR